MTKRPYMNKVGAVAKDDLGARLIRNTEAGLVRYYLTEAWPP